MTAQEIDRIQCAIRHIQTAVDVDDWAKEIAVEAMKRQIPEKPAERRDKYTGNDVMSCPNCRAYIGYRDGRTHIVSMYVSSRCRGCGQTIEWE